MARKYNRQWGEHEPADPVKNTLFFESSTNSSTCICSSLSISFFCFSALVFFVVPSVAVESDRFCPASFLVTLEAFFRSDAVISQGYCGFFGTLFARPGGGTEGATASAFCHGTFRFFLGISSSTRSIISTGTLEVGRAGGPRCSAGEEDHGNGALLLGSCEGMFFLAACLSLMLAYSLLVGGVSSRGSRVLLWSGGGALGGGGDGARKLLGELPKL